MLCDLLLDKKTDYVFDQLIDLIKALWLTAGQDDWLLVSQLND